MYCRRTSRLSGEIRTLYCRTKCIVGEPHDINKCIVGEPPDFATERAELNAVEPQDINKCIVGEPLDFATERAELNAVEPQEAWAIITRFTTHNTILLSA